MKALTHNIAKIAADTVEQNRSTLWYDERRKRVTSSLFGSVFRARIESTLNNIANEIVFKKPVHTDPTSHGCLMRALDYSAISASVISIAKKKTGLIVHPEFPFLGASPDALVGNEGLFEMKCPYKARNSAIEDIHLEYLDTNRKLKKNRNYFFQIQGLFTDRNWCDFMVCTIYQ